MIKIWILILTLRFKTRVIRKFKVVLVYLPLARNVRVLQTRKVKVLMWIKKITEMKKIKEERKTLIGIITLLKM